MGGVEDMGGGGERGSQKKERRPFSQYLDKPTGLRKRTKERNKENNYLVQKVVEESRTVQ
jgi:hypothetical protein